MTQMIRLPEVRKLSALSRSTIYAMVKNGTFPAPRRIGQRAVAWDKSEVTMWLAGRPLSKGG